MEPSSQPARSPEGSCRLLDACRFRNVGRPPVWIMRQAGRYLPEYRELRQRHSFVEMCTVPELSAEVSLQPWRRFGLDAVIVFYDILFIAEAMGACLSFTESGPKFERPVRTDEDVAGLHDPDLRALPPADGTGAILSTLRILRSAVPPEVAVLGFAGGPFTIAAYLVEGSFERGGERIRRLLHQSPATVRRLLERISRATADYLVAQVEAGASAVQLFDTWAGVLDPQEYREFALPYEREAMSKALAAGVPVILYVNGCSHLLEDLPASGATVLSVDWRQPLGGARRLLGSRMALQGNLDPAALFAPAEEVRRRTSDLLRDRRDDPGYIANLGHGILPETPIASVEAFLQTVRSEG